VLSHVIQSLSKNADGSAGAAITGSLQTFGPPGERVAELTRTATPRGVPPSSLIAIDAINQRWWLAS
jgi:hypothetical protein